MLKNMMFLKSEVQRIEGLKDSLTARLTEEPNEFGNEMLDFYKNQLTLWKDLYKQNLILFISRTLVFLALFFIGFYFIWGFGLFFIFANVCFFLAAVTLFTIAKERLIRLSAILAICLTAISTILSICRF